MARFSRGYEVLRTYVRLAFWLTHRHIIVTGKENIPTGVPVIFAANHQNALMDPLALSCTNPLQTVWLARADLFKNRFARPLLKFFKMLPIYRIRDGKENLSNNELIFKQVASVLEQKDSIALFPEAAHSFKRQMLPHRKAIPRIALDAEADNNFTLGLKIVPAGIYYDHYYNFNRSFIVRYGQPIDVDAYRDAWEANPQAAMLKLRDAIYDGIIPLTLQLSSVDHYDDYEALREICGDALVKNRTKGKKYLLQKIEAEQKFVLEIEDLEKNKDPRFEAILSHLKSYQQLLDEANSTEEKVAAAAEFKFWKLLPSLTGGLISIPFILFGVMFNILPYAIPRLALAGKIKDKAFLSTFHFVIGLVLFPIFYLLEGIAVYLVSKSLLVALCVMLLFPLGGKLAFGLLQWNKKWLQSIRLKYGSPATCRKLLTKKNELIATALAALGRR